MRYVARTVAVAAALCGATAAFAQAAADRYVYQDLSPRYGFQVAESTLLASVLTGDQASVRRHAWDLWAALTAPSTSIVDGQRLPIFQTWYSIEEVYNPKGRAGVGGRALRHPFKVPTQAALATSSRSGAPAGLMSFVKLNRPSADFRRSIPRCPAPPISGTSATTDIGRPTIRTSRGC